MSPAWSIDALPLGINDGGAEESPPFVHTALLPITPFFSNTVLMFPAWIFPASIPSSISLAFAASSAPATTSSPQHFLACFCKFPVEFQSLVWRNLLTSGVLCLQYFAVHRNT